MSAIGSMTTFYLQTLPTGRVVLDKELPKPEQLIRAVEADSWIAAKEKIATNEYDPRHVEGFVYKKGWGYFREH